MLVEHCGQAFDQCRAVQQIVVRAQTFLGHFTFELQAIAVVRVDAVIAFQVRITHAGHQQGTEPGVVAESVFLALPLERDHPLPAAGQLAVPFRADGQQLAEAVLVGDFLFLIATGETQFVGQRRVQRNVVEQPDVLPWRRNFRLPAIAVALRVDPVPGPVGLDPRADVGGVTQTQTHGPRLAGFQFDVHRDHIVLGRCRRGIHPHTLEIAARLQRLIEFGDQFGVVWRAGLERHHALQQVFIERRVAFKLDLAQ
ncbi:hypothetical protein D3C72_632190 [compost metagenome]